MEKFIEYLKRAFNAPKVLQSFILGLFVAALFTITLPVEWVLMPIFILALAINMFSKKDVGHFSSNAIFCMLGGVVVWLLIILQ